MRYEIKIPIKEDDLILFYNWRDNIRGLKKTHKDRLVNSIYYDEKNLTFANDNFTDQCIISRGSSCENVNVAEGGKSSTEWNFYKCKHRGPQ